MDGVDVVGGEGFLGGEGETGPEDVERVDWRDVEG